MGESSSSGTPSSSSSHPSVIINNTEDKHRMEQENQLLAEKQGYNLQNILSQSKNTSLNDLTNSAQHVFTTPCFRTSFLWASGIGILLALHRYRQPLGTVLKATNTGVLGFFSTFGIQWYLCRRDEHDRKLALRAFYQNQQRIRASLRPLPTNNPDNDEDLFGNNSAVLSSSSLGIGSGSVEESEGKKQNSNLMNKNNNNTNTNNDEEWLKEIDRITGYDLPKVQRGPTESITLQ